MKTEIRYEIVEKRNYVYLTINDNVIKRYPKSYPTGEGTHIGDWGLRRAKDDLKLVKRALRGVK